MKPLTQDKSIQTDPVKILPIDTYATNSESRIPLETQQNEIYKSTEYVNVTLSNHLSPTGLLSETYQIYDDNDDTPYATNEYNTSKEQSTRNYESFRVEDESPHETTPETTKNPMPLFKPIYILKESLPYIAHDWEVGDEFEFISHVDDNPSMVCLKHLRTGEVENVDRSYFELDVTTPLRLGIEGRGAAECFLLKCDARYSFLIYRSDQDENLYILSVNQHHLTKEALISHYFIRINKENNCFYLEHERKLRHCFFSTFQQLVNDTKVHQFIPISKPVDQTLLMTEDQLWQIDYKQLIIGKRIGTGEFGEIMSGKWKRNGLFEMVDVAIKKLKLNNVTSNEFAKEIYAMKSLRNKYLVMLLGISIDPVTNEKLMITEFMIDGDLKNWLEKQPQLPSDDILINYIHQICLGMSHLEVKNYVHRDLACRNVLLRRNCAKITDFGMAVIAEEDPYHIVSKKNQSIGKIPYRWTAPEIFAGAPYTTQSDVWSFGICLIEIWSKGGSPYPSLKHLNEVRLKIQAGYVHDRPPQCPEIHYNIIKNCLELKPDKRPLFKKLANDFKDMLLKEIEKNVNSNLKKNNEITPYYIMKREALSSNVSLKTSASQKVDDTSKQQNKPNCYGDHYVYANAESATKYKTYLSCEVTPQNNSSCPTDKDGKNDSSKSSSDVKKHPTTNNVKPLKPSGVITSSTTSNMATSSKIKPTSNCSTTKNNNNGKVDLPKETDEHITSCYF